MADAIDPKFRELKEAVDRVHSIISDYGEACRARQIPDSYASAVRNVQIYSNRGLEASDVAARIKEQAIGSERRRGEVERDERLALLAIELDRLRAILPAAAARASIRIGQIARDLKAEAESNSGERQ